MATVIPGALADYLTVEPPLDVDTRAALDAARRGRGRTLVIEPKTVAVLHTISRAAERLLDTAGTSRAQRTAARVWLDRAGHAPAPVATNAFAVDAVEHAEQVEAGIETVEGAEALYGAQMVTEAEATEGTWRGAWIGEHQAADALFVVDAPAEQGALFVGRAAQ
ncbi:hypothetical protein [Streptomyces sp. UG1]|uniref:hypothetical protein n=1 Tax=Streptomyces sp. UG1 TaxID=3417652 RepID=UPI003CEE8BA7